MSDGLCSSMDRMNDKLSTVTLAHAPRVNNDRAPLTVIITAKPQLCRMNLIKFKVLALDKFSVFDLTH